MSKGESEFKYSKISYSSKGERVREFKYSKISYPSKGEKAFKFSREREAWSKGESK